MGKIRNVLKVSRKESETIEDFISRSDRILDKVYSKGYNDLLVYRGYFGMNIHLFADDYINIENLIKGEII